MQFALLVIVVAVGCGRIAFEPSRDGGTLTDGNGNDVLLPEFGAPTPVSELNTMFDDDDPWLSNDQLELYFDTTRFGFITIVRTTRADTTSPWGAIAPVTEFDNGGNHGTPALAPNGLVITFDQRINNSQEIVFSERATRTSAWSPPVHAAELGSPDAEFRAVLSADLLRVYFASQRTGTSNNPDLFVASRADVTSPWSMPQPIVELNSPQGDADPWLSADELTILFATDRFGIERDIVIAVRASLSEPFGTPVPLPVINSAARDTDPWLSPDGQTLYFSSERTSTDGSADIYVARR